jgi:hypothetical protein
MLRPSQSTRRGVLLATTMSPATASIRTRLDGA